MKNITITNNRRVTVWLWPKATLGAEFAVLFVWLRHTECAYYTESSMKRVLFLCSANYYRSRFAEHLFNHLVSVAGLDWQADSRGLAVGRWGHLGCMSQAAIDVLQAFGVAINGEHRDPMQVHLNDLKNADLVVALKELEHRPEIRRQFPDWEDQIEFWDVHDLDCATPEEALPYLKEKVQTLVKSLRS